MAARPRLAVPWAAAGLLVLLTWLGWREMSFLNDDAYITFRYVGNRRLGHGYVWNPPPFPPVEGYTNFLWMVLLDAVWSALGMEPPRSANVVSLLFGLATLWQTYRLVTDLSLPATLEGARPAMAFVSLLGVAVNRTFLTWLSSGLETALFMFLVAWWVRRALRFGRHGRPADLAAAALAGALAALTRPDGLLLTSATCLLLVPWLWERARRSRRLAALSPLALVVAHLAWRRAFYGAWVPNTYYAKYVAPWPAAGLRHLASFGLEYAVWAWCVLALAALVSGRPAGPGRPAAVIVSATLLAHVAAYALLAGGDLFEYRIYAHLVPLLFASAVWALGRLCTSPRSAVAALAAGTALSLPLPWVHYARAKETPTGRLHEQVPPWMLPVRAYVRAFDVLQTWMAGRLVGIRHHNLKGFHDGIAGTYPARPMRPSQPGGDLPVYALTAVGIGGWAMPEVAIIDLFGLNDRVIARMPPLRKRERRLAHDRVPPPGYVECLEPNVSVVARRVIVRPRLLPLTAERFEGCERMAGLFVDLSASSLLATSGRVLYGSSLALGSDARRPEMGVGWSWREELADGGDGRWSGPEARVTVARRTVETGLLLDFSSAHPSGRTAGWIEVNGRTVSGLAATNGRHRMRLDIGGIPEERLEVRLAVAAPFTPKDVDATSGDNRRLGVFGHEVRLLDTVRRDAVEPGRLPDAAPELIAGWWGPESWSSDTVGRWTAREAVLELGNSMGADARFAMDVTSHHPHGVAEGLVEIERGPRSRIRLANGRHLVSLDVPGGLGRTIRARLRADSPFVPGAPDTRELGFFVHAVHLVAKAVRPGEIETQLGVAPGRGRALVSLVTRAGAWARGRLEFNAEAAREYIVGPEGAELDVPVELAGRLLRVRVITDHVSPPNQGLGVVVMRSARFVPSPSAYAASGTTAPRRDPPRTTRGAGSDVD